MQESTDAKELAAKVAFRSLEMAFVAAVMPLIFAVGIVGCGAVGAHCVGERAIDSGRKIKKLVIG